MGALELEKLDSQDSVNLGKQIKDLTYTLKACLYAAETFSPKSFAVPTD